MWIGLFHFENGSYLLQIAVLDLATGEMVEKALSH